MAKTDNLFSLIKSLSASEKRYFRLTTGFQGQQQNYLELFEAIDQMDVYYEQLLKSKFAGKPFVKQLHVPKNYLQKLILKSLRGFHHKDSISARLRSRLQDIEILYKKDLFRHCYRSICQAEKLAARTGEELILLEILNWKRKVLLNIKGVREGRPELNHITTREQASLQSLVDESQLWEITLDISGQRQGNLRKYIDHPLIRDASRAQTRRSKVLYYHILYVIHTMSNELPEAEQSLDKLISYLEGDQFMLKADPGPYITALNNKIGLYLNQRRHQDVYPLLKKIRKIPQRIGLKARSNVSMNLLMRTYNVELETYRDSRQLSEALELIPLVRNFLTANGDFITREYKILFHYQFAYLFFMAGDYKKSLSDVNQVLDHRGYTDRNDIIGYGQFLNLIIHYELGNSTVMKYAVASSKRFLKKRGGLQEFEKVLLKLFSGLSTRPQSNHRMIIERCYKRLFGDPPLLNESQLDYLDFNYWLKSRLST